jgi:exonuclease SbcC
VALAARLALSRLIGSQAANPPSFLVLDEVFGSLDRDRRANLLDLLGSLSGSAESFQQLFVISHVDDVRVSSAFNEVWRITELADGSSSLENLNASEAAEDF